MKLKDLFKLIFCLVMILGLAYFTYLDWRIVATASGLTIGIVTAIGVVQQLAPYWKRIMNKKIF